jgi:hypothetical protein
MSKAQPESIIKKAVYTYLSLCPEFFGWVETTGGIFDPVSKKFRKRTGTGMRVGTSDIIGIWNGQGIAVEVKTKRGRLTEAQELFQAQFIAKGGLAVTVRSMDEIIDWVRAMRIVASRDARLVEKIIPIG